MPAATAPGVVTESRDSSPTISEQITEAAFWGRGEIVEQPVPHWSVTGLWGAGDGAPG